MLSGYEIFNFFVSDHLNSLLFILFTLLEMHKYTFPACVPLFNSGIYSYRLKRNAK